MAINQGFWLIYIVLYKPYKCSKTYFLSQKYLIQQNKLINKLLTNVSEISWNFLKISFRYSLVTHILLTFIINHKT